jgi:pyruvate/2-oxoglutarate dehydrogenase complex dihydrolipoamide acyltransferase (E2) component
MSTHKVRIKHGCRHRLPFDEQVRGQPGRLYEAGAVIMVSDVELEEFGDKFELVDAPRPALPDADPVTGPESQISVAALALAEEVGMDVAGLLSAVTGTGVDGRIIKVDVQRVINRGG